MLDKLFTCVIWEPPHIFSKLKLEDIDSYYNGRMQSSQNVIFTIWFKTLSLLSDSLLQSVNFDSFLLTSLESCVLGKWQNQCLYHTLGYKSCYDFQTPNNSSLWNTLIFLLSLWNTLIFLLSLWNTLISVSVYLLISGFAVSPIWNPVILEIASTDSQQASYQWSFMISVIRPGYSGTPSLLCYGFQFWSFIPLLQFWSVVLDPRTIVLVAALGHCILGLTSCFCVFGSRTLIPWPFVHGSAFFTLGLCFLSLGSWFFGSWN